MPIYEYRCGECRKKFELIFLGSGSGNEVICPKCGASDAERLVSRFSTASRGGSEDEWGDDLGGDGDDFAGAGDFGEEDGSGGSWGGSRGGARGFDDDEDLDESEGGWGDPGEGSGGEDEDEDKGGDDDYDDEEDS